MKILLVAINAKYIHSNLAVYSLRAYAGKYRDKINIVEYTINHYDEDILRGIYQEQADVIAFSCYIWNISLITRIAAEIKQVQPQAKIWFGGPEVSYDPAECLKMNAAVDGIVVGEGEETFYELAGHYLDQRIMLEDMKGIAIQKDGVITVTPTREPINMDTIPFPYEDMEVFKNKIIYYESSRGCPYSCSYCLSSTTHGVRFRSMELVKKELKVLLDYSVPQVKFVDRTFNCNRRHTIELWQFIKEYDNGITNFHFEITADILNEEELALLETLRPGQVQLEIGVQSTNPPTIQAIQRNVDFSKLTKMVTRIQKGNNIHQHLDLIAGLPHEDFNAFSNSFDDVYRIKPDQLQLGFLKVLKGSSMEHDGVKYGIVYRKTPPYEVLSTAVLSFGELLKLKGVCEMVEVYYNSGQFTHALSYLEHYFESPFRLYFQLAEYYRINGWDQIAHSRLRRYEILLDFYKDMMLQLNTQKIQDMNIPRREEGSLQSSHEKEEALKLFGEILIFDMCLREGIKNRPAFAPEVPDYRKLHELKLTYGKGKGPVYIEHFNFDILVASRIHQVLPKDQYLIFDYSRRDPISNSAVWQEL